MPGQTHLEDILDASVHRIVFTHPDTGFTILSVKTGPRNKRVMVLGELSAIRPGQQIRFFGRFEQDPRHGRQFKAARWEESRPETREGLIRYLAGQFEGIGPKLAERIVNHLGMKTLDTIDQDPKRLAAVPGIGREKIEAITREWANKRALAETSLFLSYLRIGPQTANKIIRKYGFGAEQLIREDPFRLATDIHGIGFSSADEIASHLQITGDDPRRVRAAIRYELDKARDEGHTCLPRKDLIGRCVTLLDLPGKSVNSAIDDAHRQGDLIFRESGSVLVFEKNLDWIEQNLADNLVRLMKSRIKRLAVNISAVYEQELKQTGLAADPIQKDALELVRNCPVFIITGGPGTGKTTLIRMLIRILGGVTVRLAAPTGRAAQRMTETSGIDASTVHRLLEFVPQTGMFNRNARRLLKADAVIVDESSMLDVPLAAALIRALKQGTRLILVGDVDQLPSVGPGRVLGDLIDSGKLPVVRLNRIYRQAGGSRIVVNAHRIIRGEMPVLKQEEGSSDFIFIEKDDPDAATDVIRRLPHRIARHLGIDPVTQVQILSPMHRGVLGVQHLNEIMREILNPGGKPVPAPGGFRIGDKVMQIRNNYDQDVFNGDVGRIERVGADGRIVIRFGDRRIAYLPESMDQITAAFATSIHKSQGSEYPAVVIPIHTQHYVMLRRQLLYTAVTRGKRMVVIVGSKRALALAVRNSDEDARFTMLRERIEKLTDRIVRHNGAETTS